MNTKQNYEMDSHTDDKSNLIIWKQKNIDNYLKGYIISYYGILDGKIICEATPMIKLNIV